MQQMERIGEITITDAIARARLPPMQPRHPPLATWEPHRQAGTERG